MKKRKNANSEVEKNEKNNKTVKSKIKEKHLGGAIKAGRGGRSDKGNNKGSKGKKVKEGHMSRKCEGKKYNKRKEKK